MYLILKVYRFALMAFLGVLSFMLHILGTLLLLGILIGIPPFVIGSFILDTFQLASNFIEAILCIVLFTAHYVLFFRILNNDYFLDFLDKYDPRKGIERLISKVDNDIDITQKSTRSNELSSIGLKEFLVEFDSKSTEISDDSYVHDEIEISSTDANNNGAIERLIKPKERLAKLQNIPTQILNIGTKENKIIDLSEAAKKYASQSNNPNEKLDNLEASNKIKSDGKSTINPPTNIELDQLTLFESRNFSNPRGEIRKPSNASMLGETEKRLGQSYFRQEVIKIWQGKCAITLFENTELLIASHIIPWKDCDDEQKLDPYNGLLLSPNLDSLFDKHLISFDELGRILFSRRTKSMNFDKLGIHSKMRLNKVNQKSNNYLRTHRATMQSKDSEAGV